MRRSISALKWRTRRILNRNENRLLRDKIEIKKIEVERKNNFRILSNNIQSCFTTHINITDKSNRNYHLVVSYSFNFSLNLYKRVIHIYIYTHIHIRIRTKFHFAPSTIFHEFTSNKNITKIHH